MSCGKGSNTFVVTNNAGDTADQVSVSVGGKEYMINKLKNGESETQSFSVKDDGSIAVSVLMMDGTTVTNGFTYVRGAGPENRMEIEINENKEIVGVQK